MGARYARARNALHRVLEGEAVIVDLATGTYFGLDAVGTRIWEIIGAGDGTSADAVGEALAREFEVEPAVAARDARALLERLAARGLVRVAKA